jgi:hypothetical protein
MFASWAMARLARLRVMKICLVMFDLRFVADCAELIVADHLRISNLRNGCPYH